MGLNDRVRERLRDEKAKQELSETDLAEFTGWSRPKLAQKLRGATQITLDELDTLCSAFGLQPTEAVRDRGLEFVADLTPSELRTLELLRQLPKDATEGFLRFLQAWSPKSEVEPRGATPKRSPYGKPRNP